MAFKDFDAALQERLKDTQTDFIIGGEKFAHRTTLPWKKFSAMMLSLTGEDAQADGGMEKTEEFFRLVLVKKDRDRFIKLLNNDGEDDDEPVVAPSQVGELLDYLLEYYTGKAPTTAELSSPKPLPAGVELKSASLNSKTG